MTPVPAEAERNIRSAAEREARVRHGDGSFVSRNMSYCIVETKEPSPCLRTKEPSPRLTAVHC